jgi:hypothetical protein
MLVCWYAIKVMDIQIDMCNFVGHRRAFYVDKKFYILICIAYFMKYCSFENTSLEILTDLQVFIILDYKKVVLGLFVCLYTSLAPE